MSHVQPQGDALKKAIQWVSDQRKKSPDTPPARLADAAALQFDLSPKDSEFLLRFVRQETSE
ncbi:MAG: hypothetical protein ACNA7H_05970 [Desulfotignum sp.]|jgi:hypothetical protein